MKIPFIGIPYVGLAVSYRNSPRERTRGKGILLQRFGILMYGCKANTKHKHKYNTRSFCESTEAGVVLLLAQGSLKDTFCPFETWLFPPEINGNHHLQGNVRVYNVRIPVIQSYA